MSFGPRLSDGKRPNSVRRCHRRPTPSRPMSCSAEVMPEHGAELFGESLYIFSSPHGIMVAGNSVDGQGACGQAFPSQVKAAMLALGPEQSYGIRIGLRLVVKVGGEQG